MSKSLNGKELGAGILQRKDGLYEARFTNRFGKRQSIYSKSYSELCRRFRNECFLNGRQQNVVDDSMTLDEWFDIWIDTCKRHCRNTTRRTYTIQYNRIREELGWRRLTSLNLIIIQRAINNLQSDASRSDCKAILVDMLNKAMAADLVSKNVANFVNTKIDNNEWVERRVLTEKEVAVLYEASRDGRLYPFFVVALNSGMRMGEILGLTWDCIDFNAETVYVEKTLCAIPNGGKTLYEFHPPKTKAGKRIIPMSLQLKEALLEQKEWHDEVAGMYKAPKGFETLVFTSKTNRPVSASNIKLSINRLLARINKNSDEEFAHFTPHCLRHTFATVCIAKGMKPKTLQTILGHNSLHMTMDLYCHVLPETVREEMANVFKMM